MSSPQHPPRPLEVQGQMVCMCTHGGSCSTFGPGHAVHLVQARLVASTPSEWVDAIIHSLDEATGEVVLRTVSDDATLRLWSASRVVGSTKAGEPVAVHARYHALSAGGHLVNVAILD